MQFPTLIRNVYMPFGRGLSGHSLDVLIKEGKRKEFGMRTITVCGVMAEE